MIPFMVFKNDFLIIYSKNEVVYAAFSKSLKSTKRNMS